MEYHTNWPHHHQIEDSAMSSRATGSDFRIMVSLPRSYVATTTKYPVLYVLDGDDLFGTVAEISRNRSGAEIREVIVVGIGYLPVTDQVSHIARRLYEFSTPDWDLEASECGRFVKQLVVDAGLTVRLGGLEPVLGFLIEELQPNIAARYRVDPTDLALLGYSAAANLVAQALFRQPGAFSHYICISPGGFAYNDGQVFALEEEYARTHKDLAASLFLCAGGAEALELATWHVVSDTARMIERLACRNYPNLKLACEFFTGKTHTTVVTEAIHCALETFWPLH